MKLLNVALSILILLLAVASAVFSYFLFEKREQLVKGWEKMAGVVNQAAAILDSDSGTQIATELSPEALSHNKYEDLSTLLPKFKDQAEKIVKERNELGSTLRNIATTIEMNNIPTEEEFRKLDTYESSKDLVSRAVEEIKERQDAMFRMVASTARALGVNISPNTLKSSSFVAEYRKIDNKIKDINTRIDRYNGVIQDIASVVGAPKPSFGDDYSKSISDTLASTRKMKSDFDSAKRALTGANRKVQALQSSEKEKDGKITELATTIEKKDGEILRLKEIISGTDKSGSAQIENPWEPGSPSARRAVQGKIIEYNQKYGFLVVDLGEQTVVNQRIGNKINPVNPQIQTNSEMMVARNIESGHGEYIGKINLEKIHQNCSIATVVSGSGQKTAQVGDTVYYSNEQIAQMMEKK